MTALVRSNSPAETVPDRVRAAAVELFARHGYAQTSVQQIVDAAGVTKGAMYHHFRSKDDLLFGIYEHLLTLQEERLRVIVAGDHSTIERLRLSCVDVVETSIEFLAEGTVFFRSASMLSSDRQAEVTRRRRRYHDIFASVIIAGQREDLFRDDIPLAVIVANFFSDLHYLSYWYSPDGAKDKTLIANGLANLFLSGLRVPC